MRWSASSRATLSLRTFNCFNKSSAPSGESLPMTRYSAPYCERKSRSIARNTSESSSTLSKTGFGILGLSPGNEEGGFRQQVGAKVWTSDQVQKVRYSRLHSGRVIIARLL